MGRTLRLSAPCSRPSTCIHATGHPKSKVICSRKALHANGLVLRTFTSDSPGRTLAVGFTNHWGKITSCKGGMVKFLSYNEMKRESVEKCNRRISSRFGSRGRNSKMVGVLRLRRGSASLHSASGQHDNSLLIATQSAGGEIWFVMLSGAVRRA